MINKKKERRKVEFSGQVTLKNRYRKSGNNINQSITELYFSLSPSFFLYLLSTTTRPIRSRCQRTVILLCGVYILKTHYGNIKK